MVVEWLSLINCMLRSLTIRFRGEIPNLVSETATATAPAAQRGRHDAFWGYATSLCELTDNGLPDGSRHHGEYGSGDSDTCRCHVAFSTLALSDALTLRQHMGEWHHPNVG